MALSSKRYLFFDVSQIATEKIIQLVKDLKIDIAVDLMGFTKSNRYQIFSDRCAPIQISYLGFAGTTGLKNMDAEADVDTPKSILTFLEKVAIVAEDFSIM